MASATRQISKRRKILFIALTIDIFILFSLVFVYLKGNPILLSEFACTATIQFGNCPTDTDIENSEPTLSVVGRTSQSDENIRLVITPELDNSYKSNPGIGWQHDINESSKYLPETVAYSIRKEIAWSILNPAEGLYDWSALDNQLSLAMSSGKLYSFRVYTMAGEAFGGHKVPAWVIEKGAKLLASGEPDYSNCVYQEEWGKFVQELINRYDGNPNIAFVDISGYGNFNEWSWRNEQTQWDDLWEQHYTEGTANASTIQTIDGQARRRLVDMFIGGTFEKHQCIDQDGAAKTVSYSYPGFSATQLVMPYAGIGQSTQYVLSRRNDVGFRYDSLGGVYNLDVNKVSDEISQIWKNAPVVFELSKPDEFDYDLASQLLQEAHASLVHNNDYKQSKENLQKLLNKVGYRYFLKQAQFEIQPNPGGKLDLFMNWQNIGLAPSYPKMGQFFQLHLYVSDQANQVVADYAIPANISTWLPADNMEMSVPEYRINQTFILPETISPGTYSLMVSMINVNSGRPIRLSFFGDNGTGKYWLGNVIISEE